MNHLRTFCAILALSASASAQVFEIPGTRVAFAPVTEIDTPGNNGRVMIQELHDQAGLSGLIIQCFDGSPVVMLMTKNALMTQDQYARAQAPQVQFSIDGGASRPLNSFYIPSDEEPVLNAVNFAINSGILMSALESARSKVVITVPSTKGTPLNYTFPTKGFGEAFRSVNRCQ